MGKRKLSEYKIKSIQWHVGALIGTHSFERSCILASITFDIPAKEVEKMCPEQKELASPVKVIRD